MRLFLAAPEAIEFQRTRVANIEINTFTTATRTDNNDSNMILL